MANDARWPALPYDSWKETYATLHMWTQVVGKVALALGAPLNHGWGNAFQLTSRGLTTLPLAHGDRIFTMQFDFVDHQLVIRASDGAWRAVKLEPRSVAEFYREVMKTLAAMSLQVRIWPVPVEISDPIPFEEDTRHASYDPEFANRFWRILSQAGRVLTLSRCDFVGKCSPAHFFWGSFDLAVTRFSGKAVQPPPEGPAFMRDAYSHEVISHGFWPGSGPLLEPAFYAYAAPEPAGLKDAKIDLPGYYHRELNEFILPYEAVRTSADPDRVIETFVRSTYEQAAALAGWDRAALERAATPSA